MSKKVHCDFCDEIISNNLELEPFNYAKLFTGLKNYNFELCKECKLKFDKEKINFDLKSKELENIYNKKYKEIEKKFFEKIGLIVF